MSMSCFIKVKNDISELKQYPAIEKIFELAIKLLKIELIMDMIHQKLKYLMVEKHMKWIFSKLTVANQSTYLKFLIII